MPRPTFSDWRAAAGRLKLRWHGGRFEGACPSCGGNDRFTVDRTGRFYCRGCQPSRRNSGAARLILAAAGFLEAPGVTGAKSCMGRPSAGQAPDRGIRRPPPRRQAAPMAADLWAAAQPADATPGRDWLAGRFVWPPRGLGPELPADCRWLPRNVWREIPAVAAGALLFGYRQAGTLTGLGAVLISRIGERVLWWQRAKERGIGKRSGAVFEARTGGGEPLHVAEGPADALALAVQPALRGRVVAAGGSAGLRNAADLGAGETLLYRDPDPAGRQAALDAAASIRAAGRRAQIVWLGEDPADDLASRLAERAAVLEFDGEMARGEAEIAVWREILEG